MSDKLAEVRNRKLKISENIVNQFTDKEVKFVVASEEEINKAVEAGEIEVYEESALLAFKTNIRKAEGGQIVAAEDLIEKAKKDLSKLVKTVVTDKNGHKKTVYIKRKDVGNDKTKQGKVVKKEGGENNSSESFEELKKGVKFKGGEITSFNKISAKEAYVHVGNQVHHVLHNGDNWVSSVDGKSNGEDSGGLNSLFSEIDKHYENNREDTPESRSKGDVIMDKVTKHIKDNNVTKEQFDKTAKSFKGLDLLYSDYK